MKQTKTHGFHGIFKTRYLIALAVFMALSSGNAVSFATEQTKVSQGEARKSYRLSGMVVDGAGEPVVGATVKVKGTKIGAATDIDGKFSLNAPIPSTLETVMIGYSPKSMKITSAKQEIKFVLAENTTELDEMVVVGYGEQKKVNLTGAVATINAAKVAESRPITNMSQALAGLAPGITVISNSNQPGNDNAKITIRGTGTLNDASPLVIVDGIESGFANFSPDDVESMSVLKDAASAAIYGSRAANGVILVTTKRGHAGKVKLNYTGYVAWNSIRKTVTPVSNYADYMELINEAYKNYLGIDNYIFSDEKIQEWRDNPNDPILHPNTDWVDETFRTAVSTNHNLSISGGTKSYRFFGSFNYMHNPGVMPRGGYTRYSTRIRIDGDVRPWLNLGMQFNGYMGEMEAAGAYKSGSTGVDDIFDYACMTSPGIVFRHPVDGRFGTIANPEDNTDVNNHNPYIQAYKNDRKFNTQQANARFFATIKPFKGFSIDGAFSVNTFNRDIASKPVVLDQWNFELDEVVQQVKKQTIINRYDEKIRRLYSELIARYKATFFNKLDLNLMAGTTHEMRRTQDFSASRQDITDPSLWALDACTGDAKAGGSATEWSMASFFGRVNLAWDDKYLFEFNIRRDGSSRFQPNKRWGNFPSASVGWRLDRENYMQFATNKGLSQFKIRASYGKLGNNSVGNYDSQSLYSNSGNAYVLNNVYQTGMAINSLANPNLTWETTNVFDAAVDLGFFSNRLTFTAEYFHKKTNNILISVVAPLVHGDASIPKSNSAEVINQGIELQAGWKSNINDFHYGIDANFTYVTNVVSKYLGKDMSGMRISGTNIIWEGHPINAHYLLVADRIIQTEEDLQIVKDMIANAPLDENGRQKDPFAYTGTPEMGDLLYRDLNGDGVVDQNDRTICSNGTAPRFLFGTNLNASWKGFDLNILINGVFGRKSYYYGGTRNTSIVNYGSMINKEVAEGRWYEGRTDATYPRLSYKDDKRNIQASTFMLYNMDYVKIKNITLGYTLPTKWVKACTLDKVRFYCTLENFFTFTGYTGWDPEISGVDYPTMRQVTLGVNVSF